ncbi:unnamed protein product [Symbiodinium sp. CCMP2592]|nr:unnamed protein product [Symbiodinium sp. CCMP2592]CAE7658973.1 unnamed protein product [Symbiodinium sp. CCMP2592]
MWHDASLSLFLHRLCKLKAPKVLIFAVLLLYWSENVTIRADSVEWLEFFAGDAQITRHVSACGYTSRKFDLRYPIEYKHQNYMDLLTPAGMAQLAIVGVMSAVQGKAVVWLGLVCSSFTVINMGWSKRSFLVPMGDTSKRSVVEGNCLAARTCILIQLILALDGAQQMAGPTESDLEKRIKELRCYIDESAPPAAKKPKLTEPKSLDPLFAETLQMPSTPAPSELNRKMNMLQAAKAADPASKASSIAAAKEKEIEEPEKSSDEGDDDDDDNDPDKGDWGLGTTLCPKTGKVPDQHMVVSLDALKQRLRRACKRRKNGKVPGGEAAFEAYQDVENRKQLAKLLVEAKFNEDR